jgi:hypothetical protein
MQTDYNRQQRRQRLEREIQRFEGQLKVFSDRSTPQRKRCYTVALRCLKRRTDDLAKLTS